MIGPERDSHGFPAAECERISDTRATRLPLDRDRAGCAIPQSHEIWVQGSSFTHGTATWLILGKGVVWHVAKEAARSA